MINIRLWISSALVLLGIYGVVLALQDESRFVTDLPETKVEGGV